MQKFDFLNNSFSIIERNDKTITVLNEEHPEYEKIKQIVLSLIDDTGFDLAYDIVSDAVNNLIEIGDGDIDDYQVDNSSVYYAEQLSYLKIQNQYDIAQIVKDYDCKNIGDACAIWYNDKVYEAMQKINNLYS